MSRLLLWTLRLLAVLLFVLAGAAFYLDGRGWGFAALLGAILAGAGSDMLGES